MNVSLILLLVEVIPCYSYICEQWDMDFKLCHL